ncbi:hypothetical protein [Polaribacter aquimarinus]|uniref:TonB C-terminal domain-containing protein n=1 Tax=Polaribacter aquimarinus TaxID=2100726 RepID=A0A2U2JAZ0_9FLAO|nr:hypothetical protein [Polaribacter aquimarinus]PWG05508.1 hypothetical protein DIS07_07520 [Polaribacter aquimarinus]
MKNLKTIITVVAISLSTVFSATAVEKNPLKKEKTIRTEIVSLLGDNIPFQINHSCRAEISFIINNNNEVVVLNVDSKIAKFESFVKRKLNYKKLSLKNIKKGEVYRIPVKLNAA